VERLPPNKQLGGTGFSFGGAPAATPGVALAAAAGGVSHSVGEVLHQPPNQQLWRKCFFWGGALQAEHHEQDFIWCRTCQLLSNHVGVGARDVKPATLQQQLLEALLFRLASFRCHCLPTHRRNLVTVCCKT